MSLSLGESGCRQSGDGSPHLRLYQHLLSLSEATFTAVHELFILSVLFLSFFATIIIVAVVLVIIVVVVVFPYQHLLSLSEATFTASPESLSMLLSLGLLLLLLLLSLSVL